MLEAQAVTLDPDKGQAIVDMVVTLNNDLASLAPRYLSAVPGHEDEFDRTRAIAALGAVLDFCRAVGVPGESREPLLALQAALTDASRGLSNKMLQPVAGSPSMAKKPLLTAMDDAMAAAALDVLVDSKNGKGVKPKHAVPALAKALGFKASRLETLRKEFRSKRVKIDDLEQFRFWEKEFKKRSKDLTAQQFIEAVVQARGFSGTGKFKLSEE